MAQSPFEALVSGIKTGREIGTEVAQSNILQQVYAGADASQLTPEQQQGALNKASVLASQKGLGSLAYSFQKQSSELAKNNSAQELNKITTAQAEMSYAGQLLKGASSTDDLNAIVDSTVKDTSTNLLVKKVLRDPNMSFEQKKQTLAQMAQTQEENLKAQQLTIQGMTAMSNIQNKSVDNARADLKIAADLGMPVQRSKYVTVFGEAATQAAEAKGTRFVADTGEATTTPGGEAPTFLQGRAAMESKGDYSAVNKETGAMGKYQITQSTYANLRKIDPSLPADPKAFLADPKAQDKAANLLEAENIKEIKAAGLKPSQTNKDLYWMFGAKDAKSIRDKFEDNPNAKIESVVGENVIKANPSLAGKTVAQVNAGNVSLPKEGEGPTALSKVARSGAAGERASNIVGAVNQATAKLENIANLPGDTTLGAFAGLTGKDQKGILTGLEALSARNLTTQDQRAMEQMISSISKDMATALGGGFATAATASKMEQYQKSVPREGDNRLNAALFLAELKQELQIEAKEFNTRTAATEEQRKLVNDAVAKLDKVIPFNVKDVTDSMKKTGRGTMAGVSAQTVKPPSTGTIIDGYRFKGGDAGKKENWEKVQ